MPINNKINGYCTGDNNQLAAVCVGGFYPVNVWQNKNTKANAVKIHAPVKISHVFMAMGQAVPRGRKRAVKKVEKWPDRLCLHPGMQQLRFVRLLAFN